MDFRVGGIEAQLFIVQYVIHESPVSVQMRKDEAGAIMQFNRSFIDQHRDDILIRTEILDDFLLDLERELLWIESAREGVDLQRRHDPLLEKQDVFGSDTRNIPIQRITLIRIFEGLSDALNRLDERFSGRGVGWGSDRLERSQFEDIAIGDVILVGSRRSEILERNANF